MVDYHSMSRYVRATFDDRSEEDSVSEEGGLDAVEARPSHRQEKRHKLEVSLGSAAFFRTQVADKLVSS